MSLRNAVFWNCISQFGQSGISFLSIIILARMLTPADFGIIGIVTIFIAICQMMVDSQMGGALIRKKEVAKTDYSTLFWYNLGVSILLFLLLYSVAPLISSFYNDEDLILIIRILSITIILHALRITQRIMIYRNYQFKILAIINVSSGFISLIISVFFAMNGMGYWALIIMNITNALIGLIFMELYNCFIPTLQFSKSSFKYQFGFGVNLLCSDLIRVVANNISTNIIAKISNLNFTGFYNQSQKITDYCQNTLGGIIDQSIYPYMARMKKSKEIDSFYTKILILAIITVSIIVVILYIFASPIINIVLGTQWLEASWILQILSIGILPSTIQLISRNVLKTYGATKKILLVESIKSISLLSLLLVGVYIGIQAIVWAVVISQILSCIIMMVMARIEIRNTMEIND